MRTVATHKDTARIHIAGWKSGEMKTVMMKLRRPENGGDANCSERPARRECSTHVTMTVSWERNQPASGHVGLHNV
jgi:hypothetical protein